MNITNSLQATGAGRSDLDGVGDWLLPGFVAASLPAPVPEPSSNMLFNDAKNVAGYVDGHVGYIKIYRDENPSTNGPSRFYSCFYDPPESYDYQWSPN